MQLDIDKVIKNETFIELVRDELKRIKEKRELRPEPKQGFKYKRDFYDRLLDNNNFNASFFCSNYVAVLYKKSNLNNEERSVIRYVCDKALNEYAVLIKNLKNEKENIVFKSS